MGFYKLKLAGTLIILEIIMIVLFAIFVRYGNEGDATNIMHNEEQSHKAQEEHKHYYPMFQDVHVMVFIGFGMLMTFLKKYSFGSVGFNLLLAAFAIQWSILLHGFFHESFHTIHISIETLIDGDFGAAAVLISFGAVLGKTSALQLVVMAVFELIFYHLNFYIGLEYYHVSDVGGSMFIHIFGAYFGLAFSRMVYRKDVEEQEHDEGSNYHSDVFAMIGTLFLWMFWPSFNAALATGDEEKRAIMNTYFSLAACAVSSFACSALVHKNGKLDMVHIQNATLAGGVAIGTCADMQIQPWAAIVIGSIAGVISVLGYTFFTPYLNKAISLHDTCGVHNLHGMPGILAAVAGILAAATANTDTYGNSLYELFPERAPSNSTGFVSPGNDRSAASQAAYQAAALLTTIGISVGGGLLCGAFLRHSIFEQPRSQQIFNDGSYWLVPGDEDESDVEKQGEVQLNGVTEINPEDKADSKTTISTIG